MKPYYTSEAFHVGDNKYGERVAVPADVCGNLPNFVREYDITSEVETITGKFWGRLSASGYMDCTDWDGPYDTLAEAKASLAEMFDVDADTGRSFSCWSK